MDANNVLHVEVSSTLPLEVPWESQTQGWQLVGCLPGCSTPSRVSLTKFPFTIGRDANSNLELKSRNVSKRHAEILASAGAVILRDVGSTNGTFVNGRRLREPSPVGEGDLIQLADVELRVDRNTQGVADRTFVADGLEQSWLISRMHEVLNLNGIQMWYQPIVAGPRAESFAYEALVRSTVSGLESPLQLFSAAERLGLEEELSGLCRREAVRTLRDAGIPGTLFINTHPHEQLGPELIESLEQLRGEAGDRPLVLEIHEQFVSDRATFHDFRKSLNALRIGLAYDDFGVGQSRLLEIAEIPPDYLKFDRSLVKDLGSSKTIHANLVRTLHQHARDLNIATIAEGIETEQAAQACVDMGFTHFQGFYFARPQPIDQLRGRMR